MTEQGDARRALIGEAAVERAHEIAVAAPEFSPAQIDALAALLRPMPTSSNKATDDVA